MNKLIIITLLLIGCSKKPIETIRTNNSEVKVDLLFNIDGCNVYRFYDGYTRYFSNCRGSIQSNISCGKNCVRPDKILNMGEGEEHE